MNLSPDRRRPALSRAALAVAVALLAGCAAAPSRDDPFEPMNRALYQFHDTVDTAVVKPVAQAYIDVVPGPSARESLTSSTTSGPHLGSQRYSAGQARQADNDLARVLLNTVWGVGGI
jgi:phospholipid-binding lipoprotein MlaA